LGLFILTAFWLLVVVPLSVNAAPYAAHVIDARTGEVLHSTNANTRLHPASLTKMMTLYIAFEAVRNGEIKLNSTVRISKHAASEPPSKLGLKSGQRIEFRQLIRAAAIKSANDAATAIGEAISGSEAAFARRMTRTAKAMGMTRTTFKNAHGLTEKGHLSTARDMTLLGRHLFFDYPQYYHLFSRRSHTAGGKAINNTNRRLLGAYRGADGIKTGYTRAAGFNLVASAERGRERVIATVFGGKSTTSRNAKVAELLDLGFRRSPSRAPVRKPARPAYVANGGSVKGAAGKTIRLVGAVRKSLRPQARAVAAPVLVAEAVVDSAKEDEAAIKAGIDAAVAAVGNTDAKTENAKSDLTKTENAEAEKTAEDTAKTPDTKLAKVEEEPKSGLLKALRPNPRPSKLIMAKAEPPEQEIVTRLSTSGGRHWGINVGRYISRHQAEKVLLRTALAEMTTLDGSLRKVVQSPRGFDANFLGMSREKADLACRRLQARNVSCFMIGPS